MSIDTILQIDALITGFINKIIPHNNFFDFFFSFFSQRGASMLIWLAIIFFLILFEEKKDRPFIFYFLISFLTTAFLVNVVSKNLFKRPRPTATYTYLQTKNVCSKGYSFPSGHASTAFAAASTLAFFDKKRKYLYYLIAALIGLSRIYLQCHYFLDVAVGAIFGYGVSFAVLSF